MPQENLNTPSEQLARQLVQDTNYRVIRRFTGGDLITSYPADAGIALVLDTETTGKTDVDKIIELGMVAFAYNRTTGEVYGPTERFNALEDPGMPIPPEATAVNNITDDMVAGQKIADAMVEAMVARADFVLAHNAGFDRTFCERRFPFFEKSAWACSFRQVDWPSAGISSAKLEYIAYRLGFFFEAHRAEMDCFALLNAVSLPLEDGTTALGQILAQNAVASRRIWAVNAPFDAKDILRTRGYRWSDGLKAGTEKAWHIEVSDADLEAELDFLKKSVYGNRPICLPVDTIDSTSRFSVRRGVVERTYR
jgi:DNA polymerase-3 subunit epsilon